jgi:aspartyl-tRNA(Asn)/glutamyl-tRNA(Gln) amidotransferase subunit C
VTREEVLEIAALARLELTEDEVERLRGELTRILDAIGELQAVDTSGVEPMTHAVPMDLPLRADVIAPSLPVEDALAGAPKKRDDCFEVPRIIEVDKG